MGGSYREERKEEEERGMRRFGVCRGGWRRGWREVRRRRVDAVGWEDCLTVKRRKRGGQ